MDVWVALIYDSYSGSIYNIGVYSKKDLAEQSAYKHISNNVTLPIWENDRQVSPIQDYTVIYYSTMDPDVTFTATIEKFTIDVLPL